MSAALDELNLSTSKFKLSLVCSIAKVKIQKNRNEKKGKRVTVGCKDMGSLCKSEETIENMQIECSENDRNKN